MHRNRNSLVRLRQELLNNGENVSNPTVSARNLS